MSEFTLTTPGSRGCGKTRTGGGVYASNGTSPLGGFDVIAHGVYDPCIPYPGSEEWQGVVPAPQEMFIVPDSVVMLLDMVSKHDYAPAEFIAEVMDRGFSRRIPHSFDFSTLRGKRVFIACVSWLARPVWPWDGGQADGHLPSLDYDACHHRDAAQNGGGEHYVKCTFHHWPLLVHLRPKAVVEGTPLRVKVATGNRIDPYAFINWDGERGELEELMKRTFPAPTGYLPGAFFVCPVTHFEVPHAGDDEALGKVAAAGLPVEITDW